MLDDILEPKSTLFSGLWEWIVGIIPKVLIAAVCLAVGLWLISIVKKLLLKAMERTHIEHAATSFLIAAVNIALVIVLVLTVLSILGINVTSIITAFGAGLVAVGLALQNSLANIASGILIIFTKPFKSGDLIEFEGCVGTVNKIELFSTYLTTLDGKEVIIPNSRLTSNNVVNCNYTDTRCVAFNFDISYREDIIKAKSVILGIISEEELILREPEPIVAVSELASSSVKLVVKVWVKNENYGDIFFSMPEKVKLAFDSNNIEIPYDQIVVHKSQDD